jgi:soluble lytic murein transglycosylase-like protein
MGAMNSVRKNIKLFSYLLVGLFFTGLTGLFIALVDMNARYEKKQQILGVLSNQVLKLQYKVDESRQKVADYDFMQYKTNAFSARYPQFAYIVDTVYDKSLQYGFRPDLVLGIVKVESAYNPTAVSYMGAYGLMQVNLSVWRDELNIDENRIFDVAYNVDLGLQILKQYYHEAGGNMKRALHLYNNGYLYNNTAYPSKVDSAMVSLAPIKGIWQGMGGN